MRSGPTVQATVARRKLIDGELDLSMQIETSRSRVVGAIGIEPMTSAMSMSDWRR
jgi:hypothetical protein